jgi:hypothetical protein
MPGPVQAPVRTPGLPEELPEYSEAFIVEQPVVKVRFADLISRSLAASAEEAHSLSPLS